MPTGRFESQTPGRRRAVAHRVRLEPLEPRELVRPIRQFLHTETAGGALLLAGASIALMWANSPWRDAYESLWTTPVDVTIGSVGFHGDLRALVNEGLMTLFFFVAGLEIKRERVTGELRARKTATLPIVAAIGGMVVPAALYLALNAGGPGESGWGIPMATDIAFAVGVLALLGQRVPTALRVFLLSLAIVDDIGSILIIAVFYSGEVHVGGLAVAAGLLAIMGLLRLGRIFFLPLTFALGAGVWFAIHESGVHPAIAGVVLGVLAPARPLAPARVAREWAIDLSEDPSPAELSTLSDLARHSLSYTERLELMVHPLTSWVVVPVFALANAGVAIELGAVADGTAATVALGIVLGLVVGKLGGILLASWLTVRFGLGALPTGSTWRQIAGVAAVAGIGFTVSLFITDLAFVDDALLAPAKLGILGGSVLAAAVGASVLLTGRRAAQPLAPDQARPR